MAEESPFLRALREFLFAANEHGYTKGRYVAVNAPDERAWTLHSLLGIRKEDLDVALDKEGLLPRAHSHVPWALNWLNFYNNKPQLPFDGYQVMDFAKLKYFEPTADGPVEKRKLTGFIQIGEAVGKPSDQDFDLESSEYNTGLLFLFNQQQDFCVATRQYFLDLGIGRKRARATCAVGVNELPISLSIQSALGREAQVYRLPDFLRKFAPSLSTIKDGTFPALQEHSPADAWLSRQLRETLLSPFDPIQPFENTQTPVRQEPLASLVDGVVWSLVQRRQQKGTSSNVLSRGYILASDNLHQNIRTCHNMPPGVICTRLNGNVSLCKTSKYFSQLHALIGDGLLRTILQKTNLFVPLEGNSGPRQSHQKCRQIVRNDMNFMMVCGPPLNSTKALQVSMSNQKSTLDTSEGTLRLDTPSTTAAMALNMKEKRGRKRKRKCVNGRAEGPRKELASNAVISRQSLFYSGAYIPKIGFPQAHILNGNEEGKWRTKKSMKLLQDMIPLYNYANGRRRRKRWKRVQSEGFAMCDAILAGHRKCDYARLLGRHCPLPTFVTKKQSKHTHQSNRDSLDGETTKSKEGDVQPTLPDLSIAHSSVVHVVAFLVNVIQTVFPSTFWGSSHNLERVLAVVEIFVKLRRNEELPNKTIMKGIRVTDMRWLQSSADGPGAKQHKLSRSNLEATTRLATYCLRWVFTQFLIPLLRSNFYVTESEFSGKDVLYYRNPVWSMFRSLSMQCLLKKQYVEITRREAEERIQRQRIGCSRLRLVPKATGVRPIALLSTREELTGDKKHGTDPITAGGQSGAAGATETAPAAKKRKLVDGDWSDRFKSANEILRPAFAVLSYEYQQRPQLFGAGLIGLHGFHPRYRHFMATWRRRRQQLSRDNLDLKKLYFACVDIRRCYDSIDHDHLLKLVEDNLSEDDYLIQGYSLSYFCRSADAVLRKRKSMVGPPESFDPLYKRIEQGNSHNHGSIFVDDSSCVLAKKEKITTLLREHMKSHVVAVKGRHGNRYMVQNQGIPQGSIVSSFLCNLYYGNIEQTMLDPTLFKASTDGDDNAAGHVHLLVRIVDDFLLISTDKDMHAKFLRVMVKGKPDLGVNVNLDKVYSNVSMTIKEEDGKSICVNDATNGSTRCFSWCGMLFDTSSGEVKIDYSRFSDGKAGSSLTVARRNEGKQLSLRMKTFVRPRCLPILFDPSVNSKRSVEANFYELMLFCSAKTVEYIRSSDMAICAANTEQLVLSNIQDVALYAYQLIHDRLAKDACSRNEAQAKAPILSKQDAFGLGWHAFHTIILASDSFKSMLPAAAAQLQQSGMCSRKVDSLSTINVMDFLQPGRELHASTFRNHSLDT